MRVEGGREDMKVNLAVRNYTKSVDIYRPSKSV
jgi:hypothetical protein